MNRLVLTIEETEEKDNLLLDGKTFKVTAIRKQTLADKCMDRLTNRSDKITISPVPISMAIPGICVMSFIPSKEVQEALWLYTHTTDKTEELADAKVIVRQ